VLFRSLSLPPEQGSSSSATRLREQQDAIQAQWLTTLRKELEAAQAQPEPALLDSLPKIIEALAELLEQRAKPRRDSELFERHAEARIIWTDYKADELVREYGILRKVLFSVLEAEQPLSTEERDLILDFIDQGLQIGSARFSEAQHFRERLEMQYLKLIELLVAESAEVGTSTGRLEHLLDVILQSLNAEAAAFFLSREHTLEVTLSAAAAKSRQLAELYRGALALSAASAAQNGHNPSVRCTEARELDPSAYESLQQLGVEWLVWVKVFARGRLPATLCLGFAQKHDLDPIETQLLELLGDRLALLLSGIQLQEQSRAALERARRESDMLEVERSRLDAERRQRDEVLAAISHDLKNPLYTAKLGAELIRRGTTPGSTERLADQILASIGRSDHMIHDLLDTQRIRAGKRLPLKLELFPMNDLVKQVVEDMQRVHGDRFRIDAEPNVSGYWSWDGMRRVLENLLTNAVKYSEPHSTISIWLRISHDDRMTLSVHNRGPALSTEEQTRIFQPFERAQSAKQSGKPGWGIGLTLVHGIVTAHGGSVEVDSTPDQGTTFTVINPMDSRQYQET